MSQTSYSRPEDVTVVTGQTYTTTSKPTYAQVQEMISRADSMIDDFCNHNWITNAQVDEYHDADGRGIIQLDHKAILAVTKVEWWDGQAWQVGVEGKNTNADSAQHYEVYSKAGTIKLYSLRAQGLKVFRVNYTYGYASIPTKVKNLSAAICALQVLCQLSDISLAGWQLGDTRVEYPSKGDIVGKYGVQIKQVTDHIEALKWSIGVKPMQSGTG
jgi:hypothetical protein